MFVFDKSKIILRTAIRLSPSFIFPIIGKTNEYDYDIVNKVEEETPKTGFDRIKKIFKRTEYNEISAELNNVLQMSFCGVFCGACMGGFVKSKQAFFTFMDNNQATAFKSTMEAKKKLQTYVTVAFAKGACYWGWRLGIFSGIFGLITTIISVYQNDSSMVEYITAGAITGAVYRSNLGLAAMTVSAVLGASLSFFGGLLILGLLKITGKNMTDIRESLYKIKKARIEQFNEVMEKAATEKHDNLTRHHDKILEDKGISQVEDLS